MAVTETAAGASRFIFYKVVTFVLLEINTPPQDFINQMCLAYFTTVKNRLLKEKAKSGLGEFHWGNTTGLKEDVPYCINFPLGGFSCIISVNGSTVQALAFWETCLIVSCRQVLEMKWLIQRI